MDDLLLCGSLTNLVLLLYYKRRRAKRWATRRWWSRPLMKRRLEQGDHRNLFEELKQDPDMFFRYCRMNLETFKILLALLEPYLRKKNWRAIPPEFRLIVTLRYLATGDQPLSISLAYRIGESTCLKIIKETCEILHKVLMPLYVRCPDENKWKDIIEYYVEKWNMPNCLGAVDGKHILIQAPPNSGSMYFNYKKTFSIVLMAVSDAQYKFIMVDIGAYGGNNDAGVFGDSEFGKALIEEKLNLPRGEALLPGSNISTPCFFVGDDAFPLSKRMMKPYPGKYLNMAQQIFNYRLSRARRIVENCFGIFSSRWRIFYKPICLNPESIDKIVLAAVSLHNFLMVENEKLKPEERLYCPPNFIDHENRLGQIQMGDWRKDVGNTQVVRNLRPTKIHNATRESHQQRNNLASYFLTEEGKVDWQDSYIQRGLHTNNIS